MSKLRLRETIGFRPDDDAQEKLIRDAQQATGIKMSELLRRAVLHGLPAVVAEVREQQSAAFDQFETSLKESANDTITRPKSGQNTAVTYSAKQSGKRRRNVA